MIQKQKQKKHARKFPGRSGGGEGRRQHADVHTRLAEEESAARCSAVCRIRDVRLLAVLRALPTLLLGGGSRPRDHLVQRMVQRATWSKHKHARVRWRGRQRAYERPVGVRQESI